MVVEIESVAMEKVELIKQMAKRMRRCILEMSYSCNGPAHLGGGLSMVEIMATLYGGVMNFQAQNPTWENRDRFILSKGHGVLGLYSALLESGIITENVIKTFKENESHLIAHPVMNLELGIESSNGSLGQGLSLAVGLAWAAKKKGEHHRVFALLGDGECNEGMIWEAAMSASHFKLDNLIAIVDFNKFQSDGESKDIMRSDGMSDRWRSFGWEVNEVDGHSVPELLLSLNEPPSEMGPKVVVAHTIKGKGISFMENNNQWHHNRLTEKLYLEAITELEV